MRSAIIQNGKVKQVIVGEVEGSVPCPKEVNKGWLYDGSIFTAPEVEVTLEELAIQARAKRDNLLSKSDWTQVADAPVDQAAWAEYRQALRDVPQQEGFPTEIVWPTEPIKGAE